MFKKGFFKYIGAFPLLILISTSALIGNYSFKKAYNGNVLGLRKITNGLHICFSRVQQTYTSSLISSASVVYLENGFHMDTEACFGEVIKTFRAEVSDEFKVIKSNLNKLSNEVHWFHNKFNIKEGKLVKGTGFAIDRRFSTLEEIYDQLTERIDRRITSQEKLEKKSERVMLISTFALVILLFLVFYQDIKFRRNRNELDLIVKKELDKDKINPSKAFSLLRKMSAMFSSEQCEQLTQKLNMQINRDNFIPPNDFADYNPPAKSSNELLSEEPIVFDEIDQDKPTGDYALREKATIIGPHDSVSEKIEDAWEDFDHGHGPLTEDTTVTSYNREVHDVNDDAEIKKGLSLDAILAESIKHFAADFFRQGIEIDFQVDRSIDLDLDREVLTQIIHNILSSSLNLTKDVTKVFVEITKSKEGVTLELRDNSKAGLDFSFVDNQDNLAYPHDTSYIGLILCKELVKDINSHIQFENLYSSSGEVVGTARILRINEPLPRKRLTYVKKTTKAELLKSMNS